MEPEEKWNHAGISGVEESTSSYRIRIPDRLFEEEDIVSLGERIYWAYETVGIAVISNQELTDGNYEAVDHTDFTDSDSYRSTVPKKFFEDFKGRGNPTGDTSVPEKAQFELGERRHFLYNQKMSEGDVKSCWLLNDEEFSLRFENSDSWEGDLDQVPKFI